MKRASLDELLKSRMDEPYERQYRYIINLIEQQKIKPVKASAKNGKSPALYTTYWILEAQRDYSDLEDELKYRLHHMISVDYYLSHIKEYEQDRQYVLLLDKYLKQGQEQLACAESLNERSFEIWNREKFLSKEQGMRIMKRCGLQEDFLNTYATAEPLPYYSHTRKTPQNLLILENKDTFYSMRRHLLSGRDRIFGIQTGTLIYGAGKRILKSFEDFRLCAEPYMTAQDNTIYYFGDLDYEGIGIYESLAALFQADWKIYPFVQAYQAMLSKARHIEKLPNTKEKQNRNITGQFFSYFSDLQAEQMRKILKNEEYIPQEILNISDF